MTRYMYLKQYNSSNFIGLYKINILEKKKKGLSLISSGGVATLKIVSGWETTINQNKTSYDKITNLPMKRRRREKERMKERKGKRSECSRGGGRSQLD